MMIFMSSIEKNAVLNAKLHDINTTGNMTDILSRGSDTDKKQQLVDG